jgi:TIR domain
MGSFGVDAFVAHDTIEPTRPWQDVIESALATCHALAALVTTDFKESNWCDQEVGFAVGRGILIISVRIGHDPYGFIEWV